MQKPGHVLLLTGLFAGAVVAALAWYVLSGKGPGIVAPPYPTGDAAEEDAAVDTSRLMAPEEPGMSLYLDASHDFLLKYPSKIEPVQDPAMMERMGYIPVCDPLHAIVCFPYDPAGYRGTNFQSAAFAVLLRDDLETEGECLAVQPAEMAEGAVVLGETVFSSFSFGDAAMSHRLDGRSYRAFRQGNCYELSTRLATSVYEVWEPGTVIEFTEAHAAAIRSALENILKSFRFQDDLELL